jgi:hypothetical protein
VAATDWNSIAKKEHLDTLTLELRRLEDSIREVYSEMLLLQQREQEMREISGAALLFILRAHHDANMLFMVQSQRIQESHGTVLLRYWSVLLQACGSSGT